VEQLTPAEHEQVREANLKALRDRCITEIEAEVLYATARKR
jgi:hypothetical protein